MKRTLLFGTLAMAMLMAVSACNDPSSSTPNPLIGTWNLIELGGNGNWVAADSFFLVETLTMNSDMSYAHTSSFMGQEASTPGTWSQQADRITFTPITGRAWTMQATVSGDTLTLVPDDSTEETRRYRRQ